MDAPRPHIPVLYNETLNGLGIQPGGCFVDATTGGAGHATGILELSSPNGRLLGLDADPDAIAYAGEVLRSFGNRVTLQVTNYRYLWDVATTHGFQQVDGILMDFGLSSRQLDKAERGFSFGQDGPLDMRMDPEQGPTAADLVNHLQTEELAAVLWKYGEERHSRRIARAIIAARPIHTTAQLAEVIVRAVGRREKIHPATRTFQALRIATNDELGAITEALPQARDLLKPGGRLVIISFHSLEDRLVKRYFQQEARDCICPPEVLVCGCGHHASLKIVTRRPIRPSQDEIAQNPRSRSARLRIAERLDKPAIND